jgi:hypothetical protein
LKRLAPFVIVLVLPFVLYWKLFHPNPDERVIFRGDFLNQHYVWKSYALDRVKHGELPLWNTHILGGEPFHANPQVGIFYPPTYLLLPFEHEGRVSYVALEAYQLLHQGLAGAGMLFLMYSLGAGTVGALLAAIAYMFTGFFTTPGHQAIILTASYLPWSLYAAKKAIETRSVAAISGLTLVLALMILAGHPQIAYYGLLLTSAFALAAGGVRRFAFPFLPALVLAVGIAAVQLIPTYVLARDSSRAEPGYDYSTSFGLSPYFLPALLAPRGQVRLPDQDGAAPLHLYVGIGTLLFAFVGLALGSGAARFRLFFAGAAILALLLSFGKDSPVYDLFYATLPGFRSFRVPYRLLGLWSFGVAVLGGLGIDLLDGASRSLRARLRTVVKGAFLVLLALGLWATDLHVRLLASPGGLAPADVDRVVGAAHWAVLLWTLDFLLLLLFLWRPKARFVLPAFLVLLAIDLAAFVKDRAQHPYRTLVRAEQRPIQRFVKAQGYRSRYVTDSNLESYDMLFGTDFAGGHAALVDSSYAALLDQAGTSANVLSILNVKFATGSKPETELRWCGARYASPLPLLDVPPELSPAPFTLSPAVDATRLVFYWSPLAKGGTATLAVGDQSYPLVDGDAVAVDFGEARPFSAFQVLVAAGNPGIRLEDIEVDLNPIGLKADFLDVEGIHINLHALPRVYIIVPSEVPAEAQSRKSLDCWTVLRGVQVTDPGTGSGASGFLRKDAAELESYRPERVEVRTRSPRAGFLVLSDTFRPGWVAEVDGKESPLLVAHTALRAVAVAEGSHEARFIYRPASFLWGARTSFGALGALVVWMAGTAFWERRHRRRTEPDAEASLDSGTEASAGTSA